MPSAAGGGPGHAAVKLCADVEPYEGRGSQIGRSYRAFKEVEGSVSVGVIPGCVRAFELLAVGVHRKGGYGTIQYVES